MKREKIKLSIKEYFYQILDVGVLCKLLMLHQISLSFAAKTL